MSFSESVLTIALYLQTSLMPYQHVYTTVAEKLLLSILKNAAPENVPPRGTEPG